MRVKGSHPKWSSTQQTNAKEEHSTFTKRVEIVEAYDNEWRQYMIGDRNDSEQAYDGCMVGIMTDVINDCPEFLSFLNQNVPCSC